MVSSDPFNPLSATAMRTSALPPSTVRDHVKNHERLADRYRKLAPHARDSIKNCAELKEFLPRAINFLQGDNGVAREPYSEQVAHYLMGKVSYLPEGLTDPLHEIPMPIRKLLHDLLRVHRHDFFNFYDTTEASQKTINKLQFLSNQLFDYDEKLIAWEQNAPSGELESRKKAARTVYLAMFRGETSLDLENLALTSIPPLPQSLTNNLRKLHLENNKLTSLSGLPENMPKLDRLDLKHNQIATLAGMPPHLNNLVCLVLTGNELTSLTAISTQMSELRNLYLERNRLTSLEGLPETVLQRPLEIWAGSNPLSTATIQAINTGTSAARIVFDMAAHEQNRPGIVKSLEDELKRWFPDMDSAPWKQHGDIDKKNLATLLARLHKAEAFCGKNKSHSIAELREILECMQEHRFFREYCFTLAHGASANCVDNVQATFEEMRMQLANPVNRNGSTLGDVAKYYMGREKAALLTDYVSSQIGSGDPLESVMLLQHALSTELELPIQFNAIKYARTAVVFNDLDGHKARARQFVQDRLLPERVVKKMLDEAPTVDFLKKTYEATFLAHQLLWTDALERAGSDAFDRLGREGFDDKLNAARASPLGDGHRFKALQREAELELLEKVAKHAMENPSLNELERTRIEIRKLTEDRSWCEYIERSDVRKEVIEKHNLGESTSDWSIEEWTREVLASAMETI